MFARARIQCKSRVIVVDDVIFCNRGSYHAASRPPVPYVRNGAAWCPCNAAFHKVLIFADDVTRKAAVIRARNATRDYLLYFVGNFVLYYV